MDSEAFPAGEGKAHQLGHICWPCHVTSKQSWVRAGGWEAVRRERRPVSPHCSQHPPSDPLRPWAA